MRIEEIAKREANLIHLCSEARRLSPTQLAARAKVSASTVRGMETPGDYIEGGKRSDPNPTLTSLLAVAQALEVGIEALVEEREP